MRIRVCPDAFFPDAGAVAMAAFLELSHISKTFFGVHALRDVLAYTGFPAPRRRFGLGRGSADVLTF